MSEIPAIDRGIAGRITPSGRDASTETRAADAGARPGEIARGADRVELSDRARLLQKLQSAPEIRTELVERVRREIEAGTYDSAERFDAAADALIAEEYEGN